MSNLYDCLIVGSGPAGTTAAYHLAKRGRSVLILEKEKLPRYKPCGGGVAPAIQQWFDFDFSPVISLKASVNHYTWNKGDSFEADLNTIEPIWMVRRDHFDHFLVQQSQKQGAQLQPETFVTGVSHQGKETVVHTQNGDYRGRYLIAADGGRGPVSTWLGFKKRKRSLAGALEAEIPIANQTERRVFFDFGLVQSGYLWNFPKADGYSLGIGAFSDRGKQNLRAKLADYAQLFDVDLSQAQLCAHPISLWNGHQTLNTDYALLAGEAACVVDPFTAEGIRPSIFSGMKAAEAIDGALNGDPNALANYSRVIAQELGSEMMWAKRLADVFYRVPKMGYQVGIKRASATRTLGKILTGELCYSDVAHRGIQRLMAHMTPG